MNHKVSFRMLLVLVLPIFLAGCAPKPDLVVLPAPNDVQYCHTTVEGNTISLIVSVKNQNANTAAAESTMQVDFGSSNIVTETVPVLDTTNPVDIPVLIPTGCYNPDCSFIITLDYDNKVTETDENNNTVNGTCIG